MLLVVPVSRADAHLFKYIQKAFDLYSPGKGHDLLVVGSPNAASEIKMASVGLCEFFKNVSTAIFDFDSHLGWPMACNFYWQQACYRVLNQPWFWLELDCTPICDGWLTIIEDEYKTAGKPFLGAREKTIRGDNGDLLEDAGYHMVSCGVYPGDVKNYVVSLPGVFDTQLPWWEYLQWQIVPHLAETTLVQENWRTIRYKYDENKDIVCSSDANLAWTIDYNRVILKNTVVVHGCKDGSLIELLSNDNPIAIPATIEKPLPKSRQMSKSARQARVAKYQAQLIKDNGQP